MLAPPSLVLLAALLGPPPPAGGEPGVSPSPAGAAARGPIRAAPGPSPTRSAAPSPAPQGAAPPPTPSPAPSPSASPAPSPSPSPAPPAATAGLTPGGLPPAPFFLLERSYFDVFVLRREDLLRWQPVHHPVYGLVIAPRPTTTTTLAVTKGPLRSLTLTSVAIHGGESTQGALDLRVGIKVPRTGVTVFGGARVFGRGLLPGRAIGLAGRF